MEEYVEFSGKDVDEAIAVACRHFGIERDKLEVEIVSGGSSGIFGLVGVKKARVMARKRVLAQDKEAAKLPEPSKERPAPRPVPKKQAAPKEPAKPAMKEKKADPAPVEQKPAEQKSAEQEDALQKSVDSSEPADKKEEVLTDPKLNAYITEIIKNLTVPFSSQATINVDDTTRPISVIIKDDSASEEIIGKDGQTLSAIQYIANRIIAKNWPGAARVQVDTEDFLEKQSEKLQQNAYQLAQKAKKIGKTMSTRPLSSYHRRIVHMALQNDKKIRTKSKGDGPMKRVLIMPRHRRKKSSQD